jgi:hypothetical protein
MATAVADLPVTPAGAAAALPSIADQRLLMVLWLLHKSPSTAANAHAADVLRRLLLIPRVPLQQAQQLVAAGVRFRFKPLLAAASSMVAEVEVWVQAQHKLDVSTDVPDVAVAICCDDSWVSAHTALSCTLKYQLQYAMKHAHQHCRQLLWGDSEPFQTM